ncbi:metallophosphoesterase [Streptomyces capparidis]
MGVPEPLAERLSMAEQHEYLRSRFGTRMSRRGLLRGGTAAAGTAAGAGLLGGSARATAGPAAGPTLVTRPATAEVDGALVAPFGRHLAFGADPRTQMRISWQVPVAVRRPYVRVGPRPWELSRKLPARLVPLRTPALGGRTGPVEQYYLHAALDGLRPGTTYYYGCGHDGFDPATPGALHTLGSFTTAPEPAARRPFTFTAFGDQGVGAHAVANDSVLLAQNPAFHLHAGDIAYADVSGHGTEQDTYDPRSWDVFFAQTEPVASRVPWMVTTGNHDMEPWYSPNGYGGDQARFAFPGGGPAPDLAPGVYAFTYGNVGVVALDGNDVSHEIRANLGYTAGGQTAWLDRELARLRAAPGIDFLVVFFHHCAFSTTRAHASDGGVREEWVPLFDRHRVDLVVNGHNHVYERTDAIRGGAVRPVPIGGTVRPESDGAVYITAGGAGAALYNFPAPDVYDGHGRAHADVASYHWTESGDKQPETVTWSRVRYTGFSFIRVDSVPAPRGRAARLTVTALSDTGKRVDRFTVERTAR